MVKAYAFTGPKEQIARELEKINQRIVEAIVFVEDADRTSIPSGQSMFDEMDSHLVNVLDVDYSRESIYENPDEE